MNGERLAKRYAQAFFHASYKKNILDSVEKDFILISNAYKEVEKLKEFMNHNDQSCLVKEDILKKIFEEKIEPFTFSALHLLLNKHREGLLEPIIKEFTTLCYKQKGFLEVHIYSTASLDESIKEQIINKFEKETGKKIVSLFHIHSDLIGGIKITYNNLQIDGSVQGGLYRLQEKLIHDMTKQ